MTKVIHSAFSRIRYLVDPGQPSALAIPLGLAVEVVIGDQWIIGLCARTGLVPDEIQVLDGIGRELLQNPFETLRREMSPLVQKIAKAGDALEILSSTNIWSLNVTPAEKWPQTFQQNVSIEAQIKEKMVALWKDVLQELAMPSTAPPATAKRRSAPSVRHRALRRHFAIPAGRSFVQENFWRGEAPRRAA